MTLHPLDTIFANIQAGITGTTPGVTDAQQPDEYTMADSLEELAETPNSRRAFLILARGTDPDGYRDFTGVGGDEAAFVRVEVHVTHVSEGKTPHAWALQLAKERLAIIDNIRDTVLNGGGGVTTCELESTGLDDDDGMSSVWVSMFVFRIEYQCDIAM